MYKFEKIKGNESAVRLKILYRGEQRLSFKEVFKLTVIQGNSHL